MCIHESAQSRILIHAHYIVINAARKQTFHKFSKSQPSHSSDLNILLLDTRTGILTLRRQFLLNLRRNFLLDLLCARLLARRTLLTILASRTLLRRLGRILLTRRTALGNIPTEIFIQITLLDT
jgi:hypothetical protein